jgi:hypothetical protein
MAGRGKDRKLTPWFVENLSLVRERGQAYRQKIDDTSQVFPICNEIFENVMRIAD